MKILILIRHTKSDWTDLVPDFERPIRTDRQADTSLIAQTIAEHRSIPQHIIASPARRTMQTAQLLSHHWGMKQEHISMSEQLYEGAVKNILDTARHADEKMDTIAIVCHNPAITDFINRYSDARIDNVPTTGAARIEFDVVHWADVSVPGRLRWFLYPKGLRSA